MGNSHVEIFMSSWANQLEDDINEYCRKYEYEPVSLSVTMANGAYVAFVIVRKDGADNA